MYQPGMITDRQLAQVYYAEALEEAAQERANRKAQATSPKAAIRPLALALAAAAPFADSVDPNFTVWGQRVQ